MKKRKWSNLPRNDDGDQYDYERKEWTPCGLDDFGPDRKISVLRIFNFLVFGAIDHRLGNQPHGLSRFDSNCPVLFIEGREGSGISTAVDFAAKSSNYKVHRYSTYNVQTRGVYQCMSEWESLGCSNPLVEVYGKSPLQTGAFANFSVNGGGDDACLLKRTFKVLVLENVDTFTFPMRYRYNVQSSGGRKKGWSTISSTRFMDNLFNLIRKSNIPIIIVCNDIYQGFTRGLWRFQKSAGGNKIVEAPSHNPRWNRDLDEKFWTIWQKKHKNRWNRMKFVPLNQRNIVQLINNIWKQSAGTCGDDMVKKKRRITTPVHLRNFFVQIAERSKGNVRWCLLQLEFFLIKQKSHTTHHQKNIFQNCNMDEVENQFKCFEALIDGGDSFVKKMNMIEQNYHRMETLLFANLYKNNDKKQKNNTLSPSSGFYPKNEQNEMESFANTLDELSELDVLRFQISDKHKAIRLRRAVFLNLDGVIGRVNYRVSGLGHFGNFSSQKHSRQRDHYRGDQSVMHPSLCAALIGNNRDELFHQMAAMYPNKNEPMMRRGSCEIMCEFSYIFNFFTQLMVDYGNVVMIEEKGRPTKYRIELSREEKLEIKQLFRDTPIIGHMKLFGFDKEFRNKHLFNNNNMWLMKILRHYAERNGEEEMKKKTFMIIDHNVGFHSYIKTTITREEKKY